MPLQHCHCGKPVYIHDYNPKPFSRGLCQTCDEERCDAPQEGYTYSCDTKENTMEFQNYQRRPFTVQAIRVTEENQIAVADKVGGTIHLETGTTRTYIKVRVHNPTKERQTKAFVGDWVVTSPSGHKVYPNGAFNRSFESTDNKQKEQAVPNFDDIRERHRSDRHLEEPHAIGNNLEEEEAGLTVEEQALVADAIKDAGQDPSDYIITQGHGYTPHTQRLIDEALAEQAAADGNPFANVFTARPYEADFPEVKAEDQIQGKR